MRSKGSPAAPRLAPWIALALSAVARAAAAQSCGDVLIVLDRSSSMDTCRVDARTKEEIARAALKTVLERFPTVPMGLMLFPDTLGGCGNACKVGRVVIDVAPDGASRIASFLDTMPASCGATPTGDTLQSLTFYDRWTPGKNHYVLLITDGQPTCRDDVEGICDGSGRLECKNPTKAFQAIDYLFEQGIHTFVVGFEGMGVYPGLPAGYPDPCQRPFNPETLDRMAEIGGEPSTGSAWRYYSATDEASLLAALERIEKRVAGGGTTGLCAKPSGREPVEAVDPGSDAGSDEPDGPDDGPPDGTDPGDATSSGCGCAVSRAAGAGWGALGSIGMGMSLPLLRARRRRPTRPIIRGLAVALGVVIGCGCAEGIAPWSKGGQGGGPGGQPDGGDDAPIFDRPKLELRPPPLDGPDNQCDPVAQDCPDGRRCGLICYRTSPLPPIGCSAAALEGEGPSNYFACYADDGTGGVHGDPCSTPWSCRKQHACLRGLPGSSGPTCVQFCKADADCPPGLTCIIGFGCQMGERSHYYMCTLN